MINPRLRFFLNNMKLKINNRTTIVLIALFILGCVSFLSCTNNKTHRIDFSVCKPEQYFGEHIDSVLQKLNIDINKVSVTEINDLELDIQIKDVYISNNQTGHVTLSFYNSILFYVRYSIADTPDFAYEYTKNLYNQYSETYGKPITYKDLPNRINNLTIPEQLNNFVLFKDEWKVDNKNISSQIFGGKDIKLELSVAAGKTNTGTHVSDIKIRFFEK